MKHVHLLWLLVLAGGCITLSTHPLRTPKSWASVRSAEQCQLWLLSPLFTVQDRPTIEGAATKLQDGGAPLELVAVEQNLYWDVVAGRSCVTAYGEALAGRASGVAPGSGPAIAACADPGC